MKGEVCFGNWEEDKKRRKEEGANSVNTVEESTMGSILVNSPNVL